MSFMSTVGHEEVNKWRLSRSTSFKPEDKKGKNKSWAFQFVIHRYSAIDIGTNSSRKLKLFARTSWRFETWGKKTKPFREYNWNFQKYNRNTEEEKRLSILYTERNCILLYSSQCLFIWIGNSNHKPPDHYTLIFIIKRHRGISSLI